MRSTMEVTPEIIDCWRINYGLDKTPHELHAFWCDRVPSGAVMALKAACDEIESLRKDAGRYRWHRANGGRSWTVLETQSPANNNLFDAVTDAAMASEPAVG